MRQAAEILEKWGFYGAAVLRQFDVAGGRLAYKVQAGKQTLILKRPAGGCIRRKAARVGSRAQIPRK